MVNEPVLESIFSQIEEAHSVSPNRDEITVVGVIKNQPTEEANKLILSGLIKDIAENRVQAMRDRTGLLPATRHIIGHLQTNKVKLALSLSDMIQSVDSLHLLEEIEHQSEKMAKTAKILLQINIAQEACKFGAEKEQLPELLKRVSEMPHIRVEGLMAIMPIETKLAYYQAMYELFEETKIKISGENIQMRYLSMGMSSDFQQAVSCGANMVRLGRCLF